MVGFALGVAGFAAHAAKLEVEWDLLAVGLAGALPGAWLGARATGRFSEETLRRLIGAALLLIALLFAVQAALGWEPSGEREVGTARAVPTCNGTSRTLSQTRSGRSTSRHDRGMTVRDSSSRRTRGCS